MHWMRREDLEDRIISEVAGVGGIHRLTGVQKRSHESEAEVARTGMIATGESPASLRRSSLNDGVIVDCTLLIQSDLAEVGEGRGREAPDVGQWASGSRTLLLTFDGQMTARARRRGLWVVNPNALDALLAPVHRDAVRGLMLPAGAHACSRSRWSCSPS